MSSLARPRRRELSPGSQDQLPPPGAELRRLYVVEDLPIAALTARYRVSKGQVRAWLVDAGIPIRTKREAGRRRQLNSPPTAELRRLYVRQRRPVYEIAAALGVSSQTVLVWLAEAGIERRHSALKGRRRGERDPLARPNAATLQRLYTSNTRWPRSLPSWAPPCIWSEPGWTTTASPRPAGGAAGRRRAPTPRRHQPPPGDELRQLRVDEHWSLPELAERYGVHAQTVNRWLSDYGIVVVDRRRRLPGVSVAELVDRYRHSELTAAELARQVGLTRDRVVTELRAAGVAIDRTRRPTLPPRLADEDRRWAAQRYLADEWPMTRIAEALGRSVRTVRAELFAAGIAIVPRSGASRHDRSEAPPDQVERLYVADELTAEQTGDTLGFAGDIVLRTGHSYGLPIRPGGATPLVPAQVRLIEDLYADDTVAAILDRHRIPRREPTGGIAVRFPVPIALTPDLVRALYVDAGCSSIHIELLTGQSRSTVVARMKQWGCPSPPGAHQAALLARVRAGRRQAWLNQVVERYQQTGSTRRLAWEYGCSQNTIQRWLHEAGAKLPGRGQWQRWKPPEGP